MRCANGRTLGREKNAERCYTTHVYRKLNNTHTLMLLWVPRTLCLSRAVPCHGGKSEEARIVSCLLKCLLGHNRHMLSRALASLPCFSHGSVVLLFARKVVVLVLFLVLHMKKTAAASGQRHLISVPVSRARLPWSEANHPTRVHTSKKIERQACRA